MSNNRTSKDEFVSLIKRLNFIENRIQNRNYDETDELRNKLHDFTEELRKYYGSKIAWEIEINAGEK